MLPLPIPLMTETQERFLRSVLTLVPLESVIELHLFPPIRRGTLETGVAVITTILPAPTLAVVDEVAEPVEDPWPADASPAEPVADQPEVLRLESEDGAPSHDTSADHAALVDDAAFIDHAAALDGDVAVVPPRLRIMTASYRHTIKGIERGKWTFDVQVEADAPYEAVELVLRGVRHRSSEPADPELVRAEALGALTAPTRVAPAA